MKRGGSSAAASSSRAAAAQTPPPRRLGWPTLVASLVGVTAMVWLVILHFRERREPPPRDPPLQRVTQEALEEWLEVAGALAEQRADGSFTYKAKNLTDFLREMREKRATHEGKVKLVSMKYDRFLQVTEAIHFARSHIALEELERKELERMKKTFAELKPPEGRAVPAPPATPKPEIPADFQRPIKTGVETEVLEAYRALQERLEGALARLELAVR